MGGGPSSQQTQAADQQLALSQQLAGVASQREARDTDIYNNYTKPFASSRIQNGLPFYNSLTDYTGGLNARSFAPARAQLEQRYSRMGDLPSGAREQAMGDFEANRARSFDLGLENNLLMNEQAKQEGARLLTGQQQIANPLGFYTAQSNALGSVMNAPLSSPGVGGILGGIAGGAASSIPF